MAEYLRKDSLFMRKELKNPMQVEFGQKGLLSI